MPKLAVYNSKGKEISSITVDDALVAKKVNKGVLYQVINSYLASRHRGTHKVKNRAEVSGSGRKLWRQKGTGRARIGSIRSPLWRGGGVVFGPAVRSYAYNVPKKAKRLALLEAVKSKIKDKDIVIFDKISVEKPKTREMLGIIKSLKLNKKCLMVQESVDTNVKLAARNIENFEVMNRKDINALDVLKYDKLAISEESFSNLLKGNKQI